MNLKKHRLSGKYAFTIDKLPFVLVISLMIFLAACERGGNTELDSPDDPVGGGPINSNSCQAKGPYYCKESCGPGTVGTCKADGTCDCSSLPELSPGFIGDYLSLAVTDNLKAIAAYDVTFGDLVLKTFTGDKPTESDSWMIIDGFDETKEVTHGKNGWRKGIADVGPDAGLYTSIVIDDEEIVHIAYQAIDENKVGWLKYARVKKDGSKEIFSFNLPGLYQSGYWTQMKLIGNKIHLIHSVAKSREGKSFVKHIVFDKSAGQEELEKAIKDSLTVGGEIEIRRPCFVTDAACKNESSWCKNTPLTEELKEECKNTRCVVSKTQCDEACAEDQKCLHECKALSDACEVDCNNPVAANGSCTKSKGGLAAYCLVSEKTCYTPSGFCSEGCADGFICVGGQCKKTYLETPTYPQYFGVYNRLVETNQLDKPLLLATYDGFHGKSHIFEFNANTTPPEWTEVTLGVPDTVSPHTMPIILNRGKSSEIAYIAMDMKKKTLYFKKASGTKKITTGVSENYNAPLGHFNRGYEIGDNIYVVFQDPSEKEFHVYKSNDSGLIWSLVQEDGKSIGVKNKELKSRGFYVDAVKHRNSLYIASEYISLSSTAKKIDVEVNKVDNN